MARLFSEKIFKMQILLLGECPKVVLEGVQTTKIHLGFHLTGLRAMHSQNVGAVL